MPKDPKSGAELSYESLSLCLASATTAEGAMTCTAYFSENNPEQPAIKNPRGTVQY